MYFKLFVLFSIPLCSGLFVYMLPSLPPRVFRLLLVFGGSYLFSFMLVHLLPELFAGVVGDVYRVVGVCLLLGFFLQIFLDFFSGGIAHGHVGLHGADGFLQWRKPVTLLVALCVHALLDGFLLSFPLGTLVQGHCHGGGFLMGILLHKVPISFTLTVVLMHLKYTIKTVFAYLFLFSMASPLGWFISYYLQQGGVFSLQGVLVFKAVAIGSLLHIATTILFESSPEHYLNVQKLFATLIGAVLAIVVVFL